ncbi:MAG: sulfatase-like hydrolase/transferase [Verrucomicrobiota bacterium]
MCLTRPFFRLCLLFAFGPLVAAADEAKPNIVYIMADDLGYGDLGCYGSELNSTPKIDALASGGVCLTDFHASAWCAPSRRALLSGCHANRPWKKRDGGFAAAVTLPEMLKEAGYATALLGKWHLGMGPGLHPLDQGFDYWYGTRGSNDWDGPRPNYEAFRKAPEEAWKTPLHINRENKGPIVPQSLFTRRYTEEAVRYIQKGSGGKPFFLYVAHNMPHVPVFASDRFRGTSKNGVYGDVIAELDWSVGKILGALKAANQLEKTIVVFTSDNGPWTMFTEFSGIAKPLRGEKSTTWEGGDRVPFIFSWPGQVEEAEVRPGLMIKHDVYATLAALVGANVPDGEAMDSLDLSSFLLRGGPSPRRGHLHYFHQPMALRSGDYKLHIRTRERTRNPETGAAEPSLTRVPPLLFDLKADVSESQDIRARHPVVVRKLTRRFDQYRQGIETWERLDFFVR